MGKDLVQAQLLVAKAAAEGDCAGLKPTHGVAPAAEGAGGDPQAVPHDTRGDQDPAASGREADPARSGREAPPAAAETEDDRRWAEDWRAKEISYLHDRTEELEHRLRRRTVVLVAALVFGGAAAIAAAGFAGMLLLGPEPAAVPPPVAEAPPAAAPREEAPRASLAAAKERIEELEAAGAEREATVIRLRAELESTRAEARSLSEQLDASRKGIERLNALLAATASERGTAEAGQETGSRDATTAPSPAASSVPTAAAGGRTPSDENDGAQADRAAYYAATVPVNLRKAPNNAAEVLTVVREGDVVRRIGLLGGWLRVGYADRLAADHIGWVHSRYLHRVKRPDGPEEAGGAGGVAGQERESPGTDPGQSPTGNDAAATRAVTTTVAPGSRDEPARKEEAERGGQQAARGQDGAINLELDAVWAALKATKRLNEKLEAEGDEEPAR